MTEQTPPSSYIHKDRVILGIICATLAFFCFTTMSAVAKLLTTDYSVFEVAFWRSTVSMVIMGAWIIATRQPKSFFKIKRPIILISRIIIGIFGLAITFKAVTYLPVADATVLLLTSVLWTPAIAHFVLREHVGWHRWVVIIFGLIGVILIAKPTGEFALIGMAVALIASVCHSSAQIHLRLLKEENPYAITFYFFVGGALLMLPFCEFHLEAYDLRVILLMITVGVSGGAGQILLSIGLKYAPASTVAPFNYTTIIWASMFDIVIWGVVPGLNVFGGAAVIILANLYIIHRERTVARNLNLKE